MTEQNEEFAKAVEENLYFVFKVKYNGTQENKETHEKFKEYALKHTDNSYILAIRRLLHNDETDWKYESLFNEIQSLKEELAKMTPQTKEVSTFGGGKEDE